MAILRELLFNPKARFAELNKTGLTNDHFTFHLKRLIERGLVEKKDEVYLLTPQGLEIAGRLDIKEMEIVHQPKLGVSICVTRRNKGKLQVLLGKRLRDPSKDKVGFYAEKVRFGESLYETARRCLVNETGLTGEFKFTGTLHIVRYQGEEIVVDVVFNCFKTKKIVGELKERTLESENFWVDYEQAYKVPNGFSDLVRDLDLFKKGRLFFEELVIKE